MMFSRYTSAPLFCFFFVVFYCVNSISSRDPTSVFFNPRVGYTPRYSAIRKAQADDFVFATANGSTSVEPVAKNVKKKLCVGIPSVARDGPRYIDTAVGSLLEGLTPEERSEIYLVVFVPHPEPTVHSAYNEKWLPDLADEVLTYGFGPDVMQHIRNMEAEGGLYREKGLYDWRFLVQKCYEKDIPYIAILEDDVVAMDGWYHRTMAGVEDAERMSAEMRAKPEFLYLRMFYTEEYLGWNSEYWRMYLYNSLIAFTIPVVALLLFRTTSLAAKRFLTLRAMMFVLLMLTAFIGLFFAIGRLSTFPIPEGVNEMEEFGCCKQGYVFPREKAMQLAEYFEERRFGFVDVIIEDFANIHRELRWAITPSVLQHLGRTSSIFDSQGPDRKSELSVAERIWSFSFERLNPKSLREEHWRATHQGPGSVQDHKKANFAHTIP